MPGSQKRVMIRPTAAVSILRQLLLVFIMILAVQPTAAISAQPALQQPASGSQVAFSQPQNVSAATAGCQWTYYPVKGGKLQPQKLLYKDPDNTLLINLSLGNLFKGKSAQLANTGSTDFNGDNKTDVFRTLLRSDGNLQWQYSSGGTGPWLDLAYAGPDLTSSVLQFGNFDSDLKTDVFASQYNNGLAAYQWMYSPGGFFSFVVLNSDPINHDRLALGDFNGDGVTDVFTATQSSNTYQWAYSPGGTGILQDLATSDVDPSLLRFGDFNGDGTTDVFAAIKLADGLYQWKYSSGGAASYVNLATTTVPYSELQFGDFNGDGTTDVMAAEPQANGSLNVVYWPGGLGAGISMGHIPAPAPALRVGDFNGDGTSDLMAYRCGMPGPLAFSPVQTLAASGYGTFYNSYAGDLNGDGRADLILVSTCQNPDPFGHCTTNHLQVGAALGTPAHTYTLVAPQQLSALDFTYSKVLPGDFDGDGKTDLALIDQGASSETITIARSNGNGTFSMGPPQIFGGESWSLFNPIAGDFNGDGKTDLAFATVCNLSSGSCSIGNNNQVYVALSGGAAGFSMGPRQDLSATTGWNNFYVFPGDFNGDGKTDLVFNSTCQKNNFIDSTCTIGDANLVFTAKSDGLGGLTLSPQQVYGGSGWSDYPYYIDLIGDVNGDGRADLVWSSHNQSAAKTNNNLVVVGFAKPNGTFQLGSVQDYGSAWSGDLSLADFNHDHKADLLWNNAPFYDTDVDTYVAATSNGNGTFKILGPGAVYTGQGAFKLPQTNAASKLPTSLTVVSTRQDAISNALFVVNGWLSSKVYLPLLKR